MEKNKWKCKCREVNDLKDTNKELSSEIRFLRDQVARQHKNVEDKQEMIESSQSRTDVLKQRITKERLVHVDTSAIANENKK